MHILSVLFLRGIQKQMLGEMGNWMAILWPVVSWICVPKIIKIG